MSGGCDFISGWLAGVGGIICGHPADTIKVREQTLGTSMRETISATYKYEGVHGFFKGLSFPLISAGLVNSVFFGVYGMTYRILEERRERITGAPVIEPSFWDVYWAGLLGGFAQCVVASPPELIKIQLQTDIEAPAEALLHHDSHCHSPIQCFRKVIRQNGILGLYRGFLPMLMRDVPASGLYVATYESILDMIIGPSRDDVSALAAVGAGGTAGAISWAVSIPFDVVKSRLQADDTEMPEYKGFADCVVKSYQRDGLKVFVRGFGITVARGFIVNSATFLCYETALTACSAFGRQNTVNST